MRYTTYYLEMTSADELQYKPLPQDLMVMESEVPQHAFNRFLYQLVGSDWEWAILITGLMSSGVTQ